MSEGTGTTEKGKQSTAQDKRTHTTSTTTQDTQTQPLMLAGVLSQEDKQTLAMQADYGVVKIDGLNVYAPLGTPQSKREEFKAGSPAPSHIDGCSTTFPFVVAESPKTVGKEVYQRQNETRIFECFFHMFRLMLGLTNTEVEPNANSLFLSLAQEVLVLGMVLSNIDFPITNANRKDKAMIIRNRAVDYMWSHPQEFEDWLCYGESFDTYCKRMRKKDQQRSSTTRNLLEGPKI